MYPDRTALTRRSLIAALTLLPLAADAAAGDSPRFKRIVTLDYAVASTLIETGGALIGLAERADWEKWMGGPKMPDGMVNLGSSWEVNFELLAQLKPDLIITTPYLEALRAKLETIAPCYLLSVYDGSGAPIFAKGISETRKLGAFLAMQNAFSAFLANAERQFDAAKSRLAGRFQGDILALYLIDERHAYVYGAPGLYQGVLDRIGVKNAWTAPCNFWGFSMIGLEALAAVATEKTHAILLSPVPHDLLPKIEQSPIWQALPFVRSGRITNIPQALAYGMVCEAVRFATFLADALETKA